MVNVGYTDGVGDVVSETVGPKGPEGLKAMRDLLDAGLTVGGCLN